MHYFFIQLNIWCFDLILCYFRSDAHEKPHLHYQFINLAFDTRNIDIPLNYMMNIE